ncbi:Uncharacterized protein BP5553_05358 [Venustampulla echinocandica]|uniref:Uncharacterized protein n=1 Tax=Venustampulla echinocandica TaxID=2656787 RepID=A0A370TQW1_9HELO|nr:Uncharacterized protein BP5553_05358 [Venustampulla echinocandica]RDL37925.1 Uncharacterized protein BP5553_05358 [Venustampulla echinocandica]
MQPTNFSSGGGGLFSTRSGASRTPTSTRPSTSSGFHYRAPSFRRKNSLSSKFPLNFSAVPYRGINSSEADQELERDLQQSSFGSNKRFTTDGVPSPTDSHISIAPYVNMLARPGTAHQGMTVPVNFQPILTPSPTLENITYQHIQETSSKRISTLDYLRKAHEGRVYWFNTLLFNKSDLQRMPYFDTRKLARRATNYLLLGLSLPTILDLNSSNCHEFLKTLNALLAEFETYQQIHPPDGSTSMSRGRFPQMFKRATTSAGKGRRTSSAAEIGLPMGNDSSDSKAANGNAAGGGTSSATSFALGETDLLPGEEYTYLLTPSLPFDPDFYETFATLCDVLIDCYTKLMGLVGSPRECNPAMAELFTKADARVRKIIVQGVVKDFEDSSRAGVKSEIAGVGRVVLGGLM